MPWPSMAHPRTISELLDDSRPVTLIFSMPLGPCQAPHAESLVPVAQDQAVVLAQLSMLAGTPRRSR